VPIGRPVAHTALHVLDADLEPTPLNTPCQLFIGGVQLARGYLHRPGLTAEHFIPDPFSEGGRLYATGDLVRRLADGSIESLGRLDHQVKIRSQRVELGEVVAALLHHPGVADATVTAHPDASGSLRTATDPDSLHRLAATVLELQRLPLDELQRQAQSPG
jgi:acyl-coenzyme A synthetase/AMP-(fatty) acid ligase